MFHIFCVRFSCCICGCGKEEQAKGSLKSRNIRCRKGPSQRTDVRNEDWSRHRGKTSFICSFGEGILVLSLCVSIMLTFGVAFQGQRGRFLTIFTCIRTASQGLNKMQILLVKKLKLIKANYCVPMAVAILFIVYSQDIKKSLCPVLSNLCY